MPSSIIYLFARVGTVRIACALLFDASALVKRYFSSTAAP